MHFGENVSSEFDHSLTIPLEEHSVLKYRLFKPEVEKIFKIFRFSKSH